MTRQQLQSLQKQYPAIPLNVIMAKKELLAEVLHSRTYISDLEINDRFNSVMRKLGNDKLFSTKHLTSTYNLSDMGNRYSTMTPAERRKLCDSVISALADGHLLSPLLGAGLRRHELDSGKLHKLVKFNRKLFNHWTAFYMQEWLRNVQERTEMLERLEMNEPTFSDLIASYSVIVSELRMLIKFSQAVFEENPPAREDISRASERLDELEETIRGHFSLAPSFYKLLFVAANEHEDKVVQM